MRKVYAPRIRLSPKEADIIKQYRDGKIDLADPAEPENRTNLPKILIMDIETAPLEAFLWTLRTNYVSPAMLNDRTNYSMLSWSAKWLFDENIMNDVVTPQEALEEDDGRIAASIWKLIDEADIVVSHNGKNFDHKMLNMRWLINDILPPTPYKVIDTYQVSKGVFRFPSNRLDYIAKELGFDGKLAHSGVAMWKKCMAGDSAELEKMVKYNDRDVFILEDVYLMFRPWIKNHPNVGLFMEAEEPVCATCGSKHLHPDGFYHTSVSKFQTLRCDECGSLSRQRTNKLPKDIRKILLSGVPGDR